LCKCYICDLELNSAEVPQNAAVGVLSSNLADIQTQTRGTSKLAAGYNSSLQGVIPIVLTPAVGAFFDRIGWRMPFGQYTLIQTVRRHMLTPSLIHRRHVHHRIRSDWFNHRSSTGANLAELVCPKHQRYHFYRIYPDPGGKRRVTRNRIRSVEVLCKWKYAASSRTRLTFRRIATASS
jgi:hypothetical protein